MPSRAWSAHSTALPSSLADLLGNIGTTTNRFTLDQAAGFWATAQGDLVYAAGARNLARLAPPTSGAVLLYSSGSSAPSWSIPTSGAVLVASSLGVPTWLALGSSGTVLQSSGGAPVWSTESGVSVIQIQVFS